MDQSLSVMETCLRVLRAFSKRQEPDPQDLLMLGNLAGVDSPTIEADELACTVIQRILDQRAAFRESANHRTRMRQMR